MKHEDMHYLIKSFAKTTALSTRIYREGKLLHYYSATRLQPDPVAPLLDSIFSSAVRAGVMTTELMQHYAYLHIDAEDLLVIGPTAVLREEQQVMEGLMRLLNVEQEDQIEYIYKLVCAPEVATDRLAWMLSCFATAVSGEVFDVGRVLIETKPEAFREPIAQMHSSETFQTFENEELADTVLTSYRFERIANFYIKNGQVDQIRELMDAAPRVAAGRMAHDTLRQVKNMLICAAATMSRAAIDGGLEPQSAFKLSDLYIQRGEMTDDADNLQSMINEMAEDFAARVRAVRYNGTQESRLFEACARYVKQQLFSRILIRNMAEEFGISRSYLSSIFRAQTGRTLSQYITDQKIIEAKQLLQYADKTISEIAMHLSFSSQSHFQNVFKAQVGVTPLEYRRQAH